MSHDDVSLQQYLKSQVLKWSATGLAIFGAITIAIVIYIGVSTSEKHIEGVSALMTTAYRENLLSGDIRSTEIKIRNALSLTDSEFVSVLDEKFKPMYASAHDKIRHMGERCSTPGKICWSVYLDSVSVLSPIYFDEQGNSLFGYLDLRLHPTWDVKLLLLLVSLMAGGFLFQIFGLTYRIIAASRLVANKLVEWADHLKRNPRDELTGGTPPFCEFVPMVNALSELRRQIVQLEEEASERGKNVILRGIGHDLTTPVARLRKGAYLMCHAIERGKKVNPEIVKNFYSSLNKLSQLSKQIKHLRAEGGLSEDIAFLQDKVEIEEKLRTILAENESDEDVIDLNLDFELSIDSPKLTGLIVPIHFQQIVQNLLQNAIHASSRNGKICVSAFRKEGRVMVTVKDEGEGIAEGIQEKIFDVDFSTKRSKGTGLGLAIVRQLCKLNNASIEFDSITGEGTEFQVGFQVA